MNAFNNVNLAAACLLTSVGYARELGIPESQWIYPLGGAGTSESHNCTFLQLSELFRYLHDDLQFGSEPICIAVSAFRGL